MRYRKTNAATEKRFFQFPFCSSSPPRFYKRYRKTNAAREKRFFQFSFCLSSPPRFYKRYRKTNAATEKRFFQFSFWFIFTTPFLQAASKDKRGKRKTFLSIFLLVHLHRSVFTGGIERQTRQQKNVSLNFPFCSSSPPRFYRRYRKRYHAVNC